MRSSTHLAAAAAAGAAASAASCEIFLTPSCPAAMLTTFQECDMGNLIEMRKKYKDEFEKVHGVKLGFMSAFTIASAKALQEIPAVNAVIDDETKEIVYRNYVDISVAVASPAGLVVPVRQQHALAAAASSHAHAPPPPAPLSRHLPHPSVPPL